jgi:hypothetical protein
MSLITDLLERPFDQAITSKYTAMAIAGVFPHFLLAFAALDPTLGIGVWLPLSRSDRSQLHSTAGTPSLEPGTAAQPREVQRVPILQPGDWKSNSRGGRPRIEIECER